MIDLHCHYLPLVDDGAGSVEEGLALARTAVSDGIELAVLTPHVHLVRYGNTLTTLLPHFDAFRMILAAEGVPLLLRMAAEVRLEPESLALHERGELPALGLWQGERVLLLEFPPAQIPVGSMKAIEFLRARGVLPMIAHPERNKDVIRNWRILKPFIDSGCLTQITAASVCGHFATPPQRAAEQLLAAGWVTAVATDAHNLEHRPPVLSAARALLAQRFGEAAAALLTEGNPARIVGTG